MRESVRRGMWTVDGAGGLDTMDTERCDMNRRMRYDGGIMHDDLHTFNTRYF
jgi:hypothetical protein